MKVHLTSLALFNIGGGEIVLILVFLFLFVMLALGAFGVVYLIIRAARNRPPPVVAPPTPLAAQAQQTRDLEHLRLLSIFHFILAGLALLGMGFLGLHYLMMHAIFASPEAWRGQRGGPPPEVFMRVFVWFYLFGGAALLAGLVVNVLSGAFLAQRRNRVFSLVIAGLNCLQIPFGTALGVFTIIVLSRDSVRELYSRPLTL